MPRLHPGQRLRRSTHLAYGGPAAGHGFTFLLVGIYLMSFSTDVLLVAPGTMALLFGLSRIWDAISDPLVGYLTDRTRSRLGRRRSWMLAGAIPMAVAFAMLWSPPGDLAASALPWWMGVALLAFYTAATMVDVPHSALGAELTSDYDERTRLFGIRRALFGVGSLGAVAAVWAFGEFDPRATGRIVGLVAAALLVVFVLGTVLRVEERAEYQGRGAATPWAGMRDVWLNPHARVLLGVFLLQQLGVVSVSVAIPYFSRYVLQTPGWTSGYLLAFFVASLASVPLWLALAPRFDKRHIVLGAMLAAGLVISSLSLVPIGNAALVVVVCAAGGVAGGALDVLLPSIQADVIDVDEHRTGERKEGAYFATWAFSSKTAGALSAMFVGFALQTLGFVPNEAQPEAVLRGMRFVTGAFPGLVYLAGMLLFLRFTLSREEHQRIHRELGDRSRFRE